MYQYIAFFANWSPFHSISWINIAWNFQGLTTTTRQPAALPQPIPLDELHPTPIYPEPHPWCRRSPKCLWWKRRPPMPVKVPPPWLCHTPIRTSRPFLRPLWSNPWPNYANLTSWLWPIKPLAQPLLWHAKRAVDLANLPRRCQFDWRANLPLRELGWWVLSTICLTEGTSNDPMMPCMWWPTMEFSWSIPWTLCRTRVSLPGFSEHFNHR